ncbi:ATP-binding protein [Bacillus tianshenii]|nr:ATP-binding protein [Bacillus tianshenii]
MTTTATDNSYVPAHLAIEAMRDNGYKNTAYAVAELIDNSIQAQANEVQLICMEKETFLSRKTKKLYQIGVLDNGEGMSPEVLHMALQFGNGTRLKRNQRTGMGRFGMGLPASSISQCKRVDVWSWQDGIENAYHTYLDIEEIKVNKNHAMPLPTKKSIPSIWIQTASKFGDSGTLVVWSDLDRLMWSKGKTLVDHSEFLIGRMYRKFIQSGETKIRLTVSDFDNPTTHALNKLAMPNDPCYLMDKTSCPEPFNETAMFEPFGEKLSFSVTEDGEDYEITVQLSVAKLEAREGRNAGSKAHGKHAAKNVGVSIVRAGRELELDQTLVSNDPRDRWWGIEVEFPPALDELMGVTNNKQTARNFSDILGMIEDIIALQEKGKDIDEIQQELEEEGDPRARLIEVCDAIVKQYNNMKKLIENQKKGIDSRKRHKTTEVEEAATSSTDERKKLGHVGASDEGETKELEERVREIQEGFMDCGYEEEEAKEKATETVTKNLKYCFTHKAFESDAFFTVQPRGGALDITLNTQHPAYDNLLEVLDEEVEELNEEKLSQRLVKASAGLKLLLAAWARYEDEIPESERKDYIQDIRKDWGRIARNFLKNYKKGI